MAEAAKKYNMSDAVTTPAGATCPWPSWILSPRCSARSTGLPIRIGRPHDGFGYGIRRARGRPVRIKLGLKRTVLGFWAIATFSSLCATAAVGESQRSLLLSKQFVGGTPTQPQYPIWDSKTTVRAPDSATPLFWISDEEVLFVAQRIVPDPTVPHSGEGVEYRVSIWSIPTGAIRTLYDAGRNRLRVCYSDGVVRIRVQKKDGTFDDLYGSPVKLAPREPGKTYHGILCRPEDQLAQLPAWTRGREIRLLPRIDAGFLDFGEERRAMENTPIQLYRPGAKQEEGQTLQLGRRDIENSIRYFSFKDAFFLASTYWQHPRPQGVPYPVYWLYMDGRVEQIVDIPWGPWRSRASSWPIPTKAGVAMVSHNFNVRNSRDLADAGLYLISGTSVTRVLKAWIEGTSVSPNGCRLAFDYAEYVTRKLNRLMVIDLCKGV